MLIRDLTITIIATTTGEILRDLTLNPDRRYQPRQPKTPEPGVQGFPMS